MSDFVWTTCVCGGVIQSASRDEDDIRIAVAAHNDTVRHQEWRAVELLRAPARRGPCICKGHELRVVDPYEIRYTSEVGSSDSPVIISATPSRSLTLQDGVAASRGQD